MKETQAYFKSYNLGDWEGGIAVFLTIGDRGVRILSIPRLGLSGTILNDIDVRLLLYRHRALQRNQEELELFAKMILSDMRTLPHRRG